MIGSGPAGLACAHDLALLGYPVTIFEAAPVAGGMLRLGVPEYRLPRALIQLEINAILSLGVELRTDVRLGRDFTLSDLRAQGYRRDLPRRRRDAEPRPVDPGDGATTAFCKRHRLPAERQPRLQGRDGAPRGRHRRRQRRARRGPHRGAAAASRRTSSATSPSCRRSTSPAAPSASAPAKCASAASSPRPRCRRRRTKIEEAAAREFTSSTASGPSGSSASDGDGDGHRVPARLARLRRERGASPRSSSRAPNASLPTDTVIMAIGQTGRPLVPAPGGRRRARAAAGSTIDPDTLATTAPGRLRGRRRRVRAPHRDQRRRRRKTAAQSIDEFLRGEPRLFEHGAGRDRSSHAALRSRARLTRRSRGRSRRPAPCRGASASPRSRNASASDRPAAKGAAACTAGRTRSSTSSRRDGTECILCGGCQDICPEDCIEIVPAARDRAAAGLRRASSLPCWCEGRRVGAVIHQERGDLHPLRPLRRALPGRDHHHAAASSERRMSLPDLDTDTRHRRRRRKADPPRLPRPGRRRRLRGRRRGLGRRHARLPQAEGPLRASDHASWPARPLDYADGTVRFNKEQRAYVHRRAERRLRALGGLHPPRLHHPVRLRREGHRLPLPRQPLRPRGERHPRARRRGRCPGSRSRQTRGQAGRRHRHRHSARKGVPAHERLRTSMAGGCAARRSTGRSSATGWTRPTATARSIDLREPLPARASGQGAREAASASRTRTGSAASRSLRCSSS